MSGQVRYEFKRDDDGNLLEFRVLWPNIKLTFRPMGEGYLKTKEDSYKNETSFLFDDDFEQEHRKYYQVLESILKKDVEPPESAVGRLTEITD